MSEDAKLGSWLGENAESIGKGLLDIGTAVLPTFMTNAANRREARKARAWQEKMLMQQNVYNLPINQRKRLEAAGINPNLAFGSAASTMSASVPGSPEVPKIEYGSAFARYYERKTALASIKSQQEATRREQLNNDLFEYLLDDRKVRDKMRLHSDLVDLQWNIEHRYDYRSLEYNKLRSEVENQEIKNRIAYIDEEIRKHEERQEYYKAENLKREKQHLIAKYGFEDYYYNQLKNPYETSTLAGLIRTLASEGEMLSGGKFMSGIRGILGLPFNVTGIGPFLRLGDDIQKYGFAGALKRYNTRIKKIAKKVRK